ncbi:hypothetical protein Moror_3126 [Moniliophthora roreri MCA 2997]|uniref:Uncharacterized protein n=2 Tax=Moniliophthora roreri TaxID=221103 RepID=V2X704_MONRO|nr:hypothetical protein Moror_3126 [Moniliophthora roreri MCA 2997]
MKFLLVAVFLRFLLSVQAKVECEPGAEPMQLLTGGWRCKRTIIECPGGPDRLYHTSMCDAAQLIVSSSSLTKKPELANAAVEKRFTLEMYRTASVALKEKF